MVTETNVREVDRFNLVFYYQTIKRLAIKPSVFFKDISDKTGWHKPIWFLFTSSLMAAAASLSRPFEKPLLTATTFLFSSMAIPFIISAIGYMPALMVFGLRRRFSAFFAIYAYSSGLTVLLAWLPAFVIFTEITKWFFIGLGLVHSCGLKTIQSCILVLGTIIITGLGFQLSVALLAAIGGA